MVARGIPVEKGKGMNEQGEGEPVDCDGTYSAVKEQLRGAIPSCVSRFIDALIPESQSCQMGKAVQHQYSPDLGGSRLSDDKRLEVPRRWGMDGDLRARLKMSFKFI